MRRDGGSRSPGDPRRVLADCAANGLQPWRQNDNGWDQGQVFFSPSQVWATPPYETTRMLSRDHLPVRVSSHTDGGLNLLATRSEDGRMVNLTVVNTGARPVSAAIEVKGFTGPPARAHVLEAGSMAHPLVNSGVSSRSLDLTGKTATFPPRSIASMRFIRR